MQSVWGNSETIQKVIPHIRSVKISMIVRPAVLRAAGRRAAGVPDTGILFFQYNGKSPLSKRGSGKKEYNGCNKLE